MTGELVVTYWVGSSDPRGVADAIRVEQTIEFPLDLVRDPMIRDRVVGQIREIRPVHGAGGVHEVVIGYDPGVVGGELTQLLNVLWGNVSLFPRVRVVGVELPAALLANWRGPRYGVQGLRGLFDAPRRPLLSTAIKPMGTDARGLAAMAGTIAEAGFDVIKDDHSLANQPWAPFRERVARVADAVTAAAARTGRRAVYMPSLNVPAERLLEVAHEVKALGAGALLLLPGIAGLDAVRALADDDELALPVMTHPSFLGSHVVAPDQGLRHGLLFGTVMRLAGADMSVFPSYGGRFSFSPAECADIAEACREPLGSVAPAWPTPGGGMTPERLAELVDFYGFDVMLLVGGALHRGDLAGNARLMRDHIDTLAAPRWCGCR